MFALPERHFALRAMKYWHILSPEATFTICIMKYLHFHLSWTSFCYMYNEIWIFLVTWAAQEAWSQRRQQKITNPHFQNLYPELHPWSKWWSCQKCTPKLNATRNCGHEANSTRTMKKTLSGTTCFFFDYPELVFGDFGQSPGSNRPSWQYI